MTIDARGSAQAPGLRLRSLLIPVVLFSVFWALAISLWLASGWNFWLLNFGWIGTSVGVGFALFAVLPKKKKVWGRRLAQVLIGSYMLGFLGLWLGENMQLEGFFFMAYSGMVAAAVIHYLVAKIVGPLLFGRLWCSWACWTAAVLDLLPFDRPAQGSRRDWGWGRYLSFALSLTVVTVAWALGYRDGGYGKSAIVWLVLGNVAYYAIGIGLAYALRDNRAFCKYLCPVPVPMKVTSPFSLIKIKGDASSCNGCGACEKTCPMNVEVAGYIRGGKRVLSSECIGCQLCVNTCARGALQLGFGLDRGHGALAVQVAPAPSAQTARARRGARAARTLSKAALIALLLGAGERAAASEPLPLLLRAETFTEGAGIPFTRVTGNALNPGLSVGADWTWLEWSFLSLFQTGYGSFYTHQDVQAAALLGTELGVRLQHDSGVAVELGLGAAYVHAFSASPRYEKDASGRYVQVPDWGRPRFAPTSHLGLGYDFSRQAHVPLALFVQYGNFSEMPHSTLTPVMPHVTLGLSLRYQPDWRTL